MKDFTLTELSIASVAMLGAVAGCVGSILHILFQSRCKKIKLCYGLVGCDREVETKKDDIEDPDFSENPEKEKINSV